MSIKVFILFGLTERASSEAAVDPANINRVITSGVAIGFDLLSRHVAVMTLQIMIEIIACKPVRLCAQIPKEKAAARSRKGCLLLLELLAGVDRN